MILAGEPEADSACEAEARAEAWSPRRLHAPSSGGYPMHSHKRQVFYVIFVGRHPAAGPRWLTREGKVTRTRSKVARFVTREAAQTFVKAHAITLNGVTRSIDREEFTAFELSVCPGEGDAHMRALEHLN
jgi:hypothetical protein